MKTTDIPSSDAWFAETLVLPCPFPGEDSSTLIILIDRKTTEIRGFTTTARAHGSRRLALLDVINTASHDFSLPDTVYTDILRPTTIEIFCPERHCIQIQNPHTVSVRELGRIEHLAGFLRRYLETFLQDSAPHSKTDLTTIMECFALDHYLCLLAARKEDSFNATA